MSETKLKNIAVIYGSDSSEWEISCRSGEFTAANLDGSLYNVFEILARHGKWELAAYRRGASPRIALNGWRPQVRKDDFSIQLEGEHVCFDYAYIMQHGTPGENGLMQGYLEMVGVPYSSCDPFVAAMTFDKFSCKAYLRDVDFVHLAPDVFLRKEDALEEALRKVQALALPVFVKPTVGGSSFGVTRLKDLSGLEKALKYAFEESPTVIVEQGVVGREVTCAVYRSEGSLEALPPIEIVSENEYFDYDAKYNGRSREICPAPIGDEKTALLQETSKKIYARLGCRGLVRVDYILAEDGLYFLEINTIPGMTSASLVPQMVRQAGFSMSEFLTRIIRETC